MNVLLTKEAVNIRARTTKVDIYAHVIQDLDLLRMVNLAKVTTLPQYFHDTCVKRVD